MTDDRRHQMLSSLRRVQYSIRWGQPTTTASMQAAGRPLDLHVYSGNAPDGRPFHAIITDGLSDEAVVTGSPRTELIWYVREPTRAHSDWLSFLATVHFIDEVDLYCRTIPMAASSQVPLADGSVLTSVTVITPPLRRDQEKLIVDGDETHCLWVVPITEPEREALQGLGDRFGDVLGDLLADNAHPWVLDEHRRSYV